MEGIVKGGVKSEFMGKKSKLPFSKKEMAIARMELMKRKKKKKKMFDLGGMM